MPLPNKIFSYEQSILSKMPVILEVLQNGNVSVEELYKFMKTKTDNVSEFIEILDCLFVLDKIQLKDGEIELC